MASANGYVDAGNGTKLETKRLVEKLRAYRGRLTRRMMCRAMGYPDSNKAIYIAVCRLCREYQINAVDADEFDAKYVRPEAKQEDAVERWAQTKREIAKDAGVIAARPSLSVAKFLESGAAARVSAAKRTLRDEIRMAIAEQASAPPYKPRGLVW